MYNRYIPQADGSYRRSQIPEPEPEVPQEPVSPEPEPPKAPPRPQGYTRPRQPPQHRRIQPETNPGSVAGFLKGLLPANFDTEDLIVVLLLLLMSGSSGNDQNAALMTLGIYLFM